MDHPLYLGVHMGAISPEPIARRLARADLVLNLGGMRTDMDQGVGDPLPPERSVTAVDGRVDASFHSYRDVHIRDFVRGLLHVRLRNHRARVRYANNLPRDARPLTDRLRVADILRELNRFLAGRKNYAVVAESGDMLFGGLDVKVDRGGGYLAQGFYASMGFGVPGALGAELGTGVRPIVLSGDGAFQMTGPEIAQAPRYGLHPIVVVVNNGGWQIFRPVVERPELLEVPPWPYAALARAWGGAGILARTVGEFRLALAAAAQERRFVLIESMVAADDLSPVSRKYIQASARQGKRRGR
jgi:indolepyruvate decarboxylase